MNIPISTKINTILHANWREEGISYLINLGGTWEHGFCIDVRGGSDMEVWRFILRGFYFAPSSWGYSLFTGVSTRNLVFN